jgi:CheY-like chemotaxis protein
LVEDAVKPRRILLVDDNPDVRYLTRVTIESPTCAIVGEASNGAEALEVVEELQPDVVVMDMKMPIMDGLEATKILKYRFPDLEVIIVSGSDDPVSNKELLDAGASASIDKDKLDDLVLRLDQGAAAS